jgi:DNA-binding Lrp family transcriptional regulator
MLDNLDTQLLTLLKRDARKAITSLAKILGVSRLTVQKRLSILEQTDVIAGYTVRTGEAFNAKRFRAQALLTIDGSVSKELIDYLNVLPQVVSFFSVAGSYDAIVSIEADDSQSIDCALEYIRKHKQVQQSHSCLLLAQKINRDWQ